MKTDESLVRFVSDAVKASRSTTIDEKVEIEKEIEAYETACSLSRMPNQDRANHWRKKAVERRMELENTFEALTGRKYPREQCSDGKRL